MSDDDDLRDGRALGLRAGGIDLPVHLLQQEVELAAAGLGRLAECLPVVEVAAKPHDFFRDVRPADELRNLLRDERLVGQRVGAELADPLQQPGLETDDALVGRRRDLCEELAEPHAPGRRGRP